jgi:hypothetical protein
MPGRLLAAALLLALTRTAAGGGPIVLANHAERDVTGTVTAADGPPQRLAIARGDITILTVSGATTVSYLSADRLQTVRVPEGSVYAFSTGVEGLMLEPLYIGPAPRGLAKGVAEGVVPPPTVVTVTVKLLVDDQEPAVRDGPTGWEARLRKRIGAVSTVLEQQCRVRLDVTAVGTWDSSGTARDFAAQLSDFEQRVPTRPAALAIGFTSRPLPREGNANLVAALPVPLQTHVLIGEWLPLAEAQRQEVLLHELGHYLGAVHSKDADSAMRLNPGDGRSTAKSFRIGFDPLNALAINLVAREALRPPPLRKLGSLTPGTRAQLAQIYKEQVRLLPDDPTADKFLRLLDEVAPQRPTRTADPLVSGARTVVAAILSAADAAAELRLSGDQWTEYCTRAAAAEAGKLPEAERVPAFLLGLAVALDTADVFRKLAPTRGLWQRVESDEERAERLKVVGQPTVHGKHAFTRHFTAAAALTAVAGSKAADPGGLVHELFDAEGAGGFGFAELAVDLSGAALARALAENPTRLAEVAKSFTVADYVASPEGLEFGLSRDEFARRYGSLSDERFRQREGEVRRRVAELPAFKSK